MSGSGWMGVGAGIGTSASTWFGAEGAASARFGAGGSSSGSMGAWAGGWIDVWAAMALPTLAKGTILLLLALGVAALLARASASARHLVWAGTILSLLALPLLSIALPSWRVEVPGALVPWSHAATRGGPGAGVPGAEMGGRDPGPDGFGLPFEEAVAGAWDDGQGFGPPAGSALAPGEVPPGTGSGSGSAWAVTLGLVWGGGALLVLLRLGVGLAFVRRAGVRARPVDPLEFAVPHRLAAELAVRIGLRRKVRLLRGGPRAMPVSWGLLRPVILLPSSASAWPRARLERVLLHELSHVRRGDAWVQLATELARALWWFHPLFWLAAARLQAEREAACDDAVLRAGGSPVDYGGDLLWVAGKLRLERGIGSLGLAVAPTTPLHVRLDAVLDGGRSRGSVPLRTALPTGVAFALAVGLLSCMEGVPDGARPESGRPVAVEAEPTLSLGVLAGDPELEFHRVVTPFLLEDGSVVVPLGQARVIRVFGPDGELRRTLGGPGAGPGEFGTLSQAWARGDTIEAFDGELRRITRFPPQGDPEVIRLLDPPLSAQSAVPGGLEDGWILTGVASAGMDRRDEMAVHRFARDGRHLGIVASTEGMSREATPGATGPGPLSPRARFALHGGSVYVAETLTPAVRIHDLDATGAPAREVNWEPGPPPDPAASLAITLDSIAAVDPDPEAVRTRMAAFSLPEQVSRFWDFLVDVEGYIWIRPFEPGRHSLHLGGALDPGRTGGEWIILSPEGERVGTVQVPVDLELTGVTSDAVIGIARDALGVESVRVHVLRRE